MWVTRREYTIVAGSNGDAFMRTPLCDGQLPNSVVTFFRRKPMQQKQESLHDVQDNLKMHERSLLFSSSNRARQNRDKQRQPTFGNPKNFPGEYGSPPAHHLGKKYPIRCCYVNLGMEMGISPIMGRRRIFHLALL
jgi:hypothetical protein